MKMLYDSAKPHEGLEKICSAFRQTWLHATIGYSTWLFESKEN
jgi:hypothetical protein